MAFVAAWVVPDRRRGGRNLAASMKSSTIAATMRPRDQDATKRQPRARPDRSASSGACLAALDTNPLRDELCSLPSRWHLTDRRSRCDGKYMHNADPLQQDAATPRRSPLRPALPLARQQDHKIARHKRSVAEVRTNLVETWVNPGRITRLRDDAVD